MTKINGDGGDGGDGDDAGGGMSCDGYAATMVMALMQFISTRT